jgi:predicted peroxiredoxin|tara:strand:+ start:527 stop:742 length:216 start_codon:yes stop_codon:yes gene_type:complete
MTDTNFTLNDTQQQVLKEVATAEMRSVEQMLSMLLVQGIRFYFCDYTSPFYTEVDSDKLENTLLADASIND